MRPTEGDRRSSRLLSDRLRLSTAIGSAAFACSRPDRTLQPAMIKRKTGRSNPYRRGRFVFEMQLSANNCPTVRPPRSVATHGTGAKGAITGPRFDRPLPLRDLSYSGNHAALPPAPARDRPRSVPWRQVPGRTRLRYDFPAPRDRASACRTRYGPLRSSRTQDGLKRHSARSPLGSTLASRSSTVVTSTSS